MISLSTKRELAIKFRKLGFSYSEIQEKINVPQSTLSGWLQSVKLSDRQKERLIKKGIESREKGSSKLHEERMIKTRKIFEKAKSEIHSLNNDNLMLIGITLYWAEGSKQKEHNVSKEVTFSNSDPKMVQVFLKWLEKCLGLKNDEISFEIYIHKSHKKTIEELVSYWSSVTGFPKLNLRKIYYKKNKIHSIRKNRGADYSGVLRISVKKSTDLNRRIAGWIEGIYCGIIDSREGL